MDPKQLQELINSINNQNANISEIRDILTKLPIRTIKNLSFETILKMINAGDIAEPVIMRLNLDTATTDKQFGLIGNYFGIINADSVSTAISVKFNKQSTDAMPFAQGLYCSRPFNQVFLSWTAQAGAYVDIIYGAYATELLQIFDFRSQNVSTTILADILAELRGTTAAQGYNVVTLDANPKVVVASNTSRKSVILQAGLSNASTTYIGFDANVTTSKYVVALAPGDSYTIDDYRGAVYASNVTATDKISYGEV